MIGTIILLSLVTLERLFELWLARRNTDRLMLQGAFEVGAAHYPAIVLMHALWLAGLWILGWSHALEAGWLTLFLALQVFRIWTLSSLGSRWTTRIIVLPQAALIDRGPYRFMSHPNYVVVIGEIAVLPLALSLAWYALAFSIANAILLVIRIRAEGRALRGSQLEPHGKSADGSN